MLRQFTGLALGGFGLLRRGASMGRSKPYSNGDTMRAASYVALILNCLLWAYSLPIAYAYSKVTYIGGETGACCTVRQPEPILGTLALIFPTVVLTTIICFLLSGGVHRRPGIALAVGLSLLPIGVIFILDSGFAVIAP